MLIILLAIIICLTGHLETRCTSCPIGYTCPENCDNCTYSVFELTCDTCTAGFYGQKCNLTCPDNCQDRECNKDDRSCSKGCDVGYHGPFCNKNCSVGCQDKECNKSNGLCSKACALGYYGEKCHYSCSHWCQEKQCNKDGVCTKGCVFGFYGDKCYQICSLRCQDAECNKDGACSKGCAVGYHGHLCNMSCSKACRNKTCDRLNGTCTHGCIEGYDDETCHQCNNCNKEIPRPQNHQMIPVMMGLAIGASILVAGAVALILLVRRRRSQRRANSRGVNSGRQYNKSNIRNPIHDAAIGNDNTIATAEARPNNVDPVYSCVQKTSQKRCNKMNPSVPDGNIYDVTSTERQPERIQGWTKTGAVITGDDTYSHISHVNIMGRFVDGQHRTVESVYNHVTHDFGRQGIEGTYNVAMKNKGQPSGTGTERLPTPNSQDHDDGINKQNHMCYNTNHQFSMVPQYPEMYSTASEVLPRSLKIV